MSIATPSLTVDTRAGRRLGPPADVAALARAEARRLLRHPLLLAGMALSLVLLRDEGDGAALEAFVTGFGLLPLAAATLVATNLAALRSRRSGTDELYASLPRPRSSRVAGQLLALAVTVPVSCALIAIAFVADSFDDYPDHVGMLATQMVQGPLMVVAFGAIGILLARLAPAPIVAPLVLVGLFAARLSITAQDSWLSWLLPMAGGTARSGDGIPCGHGAPADCLTFAINPLVTGWHVSYLVAVTLLAAAAALVGRGRPLRVAALAAAALTVAVATKLAAG